MSNQETLIPGDLAMMVLHQNPLAVLKWHQAEKEAALKELAECICKEYAHDISTKDEFRKLVNAKNRCLKQALTNQP